MDQQPMCSVQKCSVKRQNLVMPSKMPVNLPLYVKKYGELNSAIRLSQKETIESLLEGGAPVNLPSSFTLRTPLHTSVILGDPEIVKQLLSKGACVNVEYSNDSPLTLSAKLRKYEITDLLLSSEGLENYDNDDSISHLHIACMRNQVDVAKKLLKSNQIINAVVHSKSDHWPGFTPLHFAVQFECIETVKFLLEVGADITIKDAGSSTPLHLAHFLRNGQIIDTILSFHEKISYNPINSRGLSHFHIACTRNEPKAVEHFMRLGINLLHHIPAEKKRHWENRNVLDLAIHYECTNVVKLLLQSGVCFTRSREHEFIRDAYCTGNMEIVKLLTAHDGLEQKPTELENPPNDSPRSSNDSEFANEFPYQAHNASNPLDLLGRTDLHLAIESGNQKDSESLLRQGVNFIIQDFEGQSPLHMAFERNMEKLVDLMLEDHKKYHRNPKNKDGLSHLHIACARSNESIVEHLLKNGADVNRAVYSNASVLAWREFTPLHFAAKFGSSEAAQSLLKRDAWYAATDASGLSPFDIAFVEANKNFKDGASDGFFQIMNSILISRHRRNLRSPDLSSIAFGLFEDRGVSHVHLASINFGDFGLTKEQLTRILTLYPEDVNKAIHKMNCSWDGYTPLHFAVQRLDKGQHARILIEKGADILKQASNGDTPLHLLWTFGPPTQIKFDARDSRLFNLNHIGTTGFSIFHRACAQGNSELMKYFIERGVDTNYPTLAQGSGCECFAPLHLVVLNPYSEVDDVKLLLDHNADPMIRDHEQDTPLHLIDGSSQTEIIDILIDHGADINARNVLDETPLMSVCNEPKNDPSELDTIIESFLDHGADINLSDKKGETPLSANMWCERNPEEISGCIDKLLTHVAKLLTANLYVNQANRKAYSSWQRHLAHELYFNKDTVTVKCLKELELMKQIPINNNTNLADILSQKLNRLAVMSQNSVFQDTVHSNDFLEKFPMYGSILKSQLKLGQRRWSLLNESREKFCVLLKNRLPRLCVDKILQYIEDEDLRNIIKSVRK